jgi:1,4-alpha-glucan branching enzyme
LADDYPPAVPKKTYSKGGRKVRVTFELPADTGATSVAVLGDFNEWSPEAAPLVRRKDGRFSSTLVLDAEQSYRYRYLLDGHRWENDGEADAYARNDYGTEDCVIQL